MVASFLALTSLSGLVYADQDFATSDSVSDGAESTNSGSIFNQLGDMFSQGTLPTKEETYVGGLGDVTKRDR